MARVVDAVVLIKADIARADGLARQLAQLPGVVEVCFVTGQYDLVARVKVSRQEQLTHLVGEHMRGLEGVLLTETMTALRVHAAVQTEVPAFESMAGISVDVPAGVSALS